MLPPRQRRFAVDLLSDTVTLPPPGMRQAMAAAELGDDVYGEDPTVNRLEEAAAERLGKEAAVFVPSGTMGNLLSLMAHGPRGSRVLVGDRSDVWLWEAGGAAVLGGLVYHPLPTGPRGEIAPADVAAAFTDPADRECAPARLLCLETPHCLAGGRPVPLDRLAAAEEAAREAGLAVHLDGARIFNAATALGVEPAAIARHADSVMSCLSKGLSAPVGSLVAGSADFVERVRRLRKMAGGGMRQAGVLAAAGLWALENMVERLAEDHDNARRLAAALGGEPGIVLDPPEVETNMVFWRLAGGRDPDAFAAVLAGDGVRVGQLGQGRFRAVTHWGIEAGDVDRAAAAIRRALAA